MSRKCAYCGDNKDLTREHIFPASIISRNGSLISLSDRKDTYFLSDIVVKDVCGPCNNGLLSKLDSEFLEVFDKYMRTPIAPGDSAKIKFNYNSLLRFLLKVSYNSARTSIDGKQAVEVLKRYVPFIKEDASSASDVILRLQIYTSAKKVNRNTGEFEGLLEARLLRSAKIPYDGPQSDDFVIRLVAFNSFWFYLLVPIRPVSRLKKERFVKGFKNWAIQPGILISPQNDKLHIPVNKTSYIHPSILNGMYRKNS